MKFCVLFFLSLLSVSLGLDPTDEGSETASTLSPPLSPSTSLTISDSSESLESVETSSQPPPVQLPDINCQTNQENQTHIPVVKLINSTKLFDYLSHSNNGTTSTCIMVLFYFPWCPFSAQAAQPYNAMGPLFPRVHVLALNAYQPNDITMRFGLVGIPTILFFHDGKMVAKYNSTESSIDSLVAFVKRVTGLDPDPSVDVTNLELSGPVPTTPEPIVDYVLVLSTIFFLLAMAYLTIKSTAFKTIVESVRNTWREAEAQHEHLD